MREGPAVRTLLLVRNGVDHDARVLRAARVAEQKLGGTTLILGVATATAPAGATIVEGVAVLRLPARPPGLTRLLEKIEWISKRRPTGTYAASDSQMPSRSTNAMGDQSKDGQLRVRSEADANDTKRGSLAAIVAGLPRLAVGGRLRRILSGLSFSRQAIAVAGRTRPLVVQANDWNTMWTGVAIKLGYGARLVYDSHELWPDRNGRWEWRPWLLAGEALFVRAADEVVTSSPGYAEAMAARYRIPRPVVVRNVPERRQSAGASPAERMRLNAAPPGSGRGTPAPRMRSSEISGPPSPPRVVYMGGIMPGRGLEQMIDALPYLPNAHLCAIGPGAARYRLSLLARATAVGVAGRVELHAPVAPSEVQSALAGAAAGLCLIQPICRSYELSLPNKLFEYAAAGVPVLASDVPVIAAVVRNAGLGEVVPPGGLRAIAAGLERLLRPDDWRLAARRARLFADTHDWAGEACTLAGVYGRAVSETAA